MAGELPGSRFAQIGDLSWFGGFLGDPPAGGGGTVAEAGTTPAVQRLHVQRLPDDSLGIGDLKGRTA